MRELTCIVCPIGCSLLVEEGLEGLEDRSVPGNGFSALKIKGNRCPRGAAYAQEEILAPKRTVTATCGINFHVESDNEVYNEVCPHSITAPRRIPVKSSIPCPKEKIRDLLEDIYRLKPGLPVKAGEKLIENWQGLGIGIVAVRTLEI